MLGDRIDFYLPFNSGMWTEPFTTALFPVQCVDGGNVDVVSVVEDLALLGQGLCLSNYK